MINICTHFEYADIENPVIADMPGSFTQTTDNRMPTATVFWTEPSSSDNSGIQTLTSSFSPGSTFDIGISSVEYTCVDSSGNVVVKSFIVTIEGKDTLIKGFQTQRHLFSSTYDKTGYNWMFCFCFFPRRPS